MSKFIDLTGQRFGRLIVIERTENTKKGRPQWLCKCNCGSYSMVSSDNWGKTKSCGCHRVDEARKQHKTHGLKGTRLYNIHNTMKSRCYNSNDANYDNYGKRGITVCDEWKNDFQAFYDWAIKNGYRKELTIDRINNNGNYEPSNCRWTDAFTQQNNKTNNRRIELKGENHTLQEWSRILGIKPTTISKRIDKYGWTIERAFLTPVKNIKK